MSDKRFNSAQTYCAILQGLTEHYTDLRNEMRKAHIKIVEYRKKKGESPKNPTNSVKPAF